MQFSLVTGLLERLVKLYFAPQVGQFHFGLHVLVTQLEAVLFTLKQLLIGLLQEFLLQDSLLFELLRLTQELVELAVQLLEDGLVLYDGVVELADRLSLRGVCLRRREPG